MPLSSSMVRSTDMEPGGLATLVDRRDDDAVEEGPTSIVFSPYIKGRERNIVQSEKGREFFREIVQLKDRQSFSTNNDKRGECLM